jgi:phosphatidylglycerol:prolipoprotein diacylglycerol transferase
MLVHAPSYWEQRSLRATWDSSDGGSSLFGSLLTFIPAVVAMAAWLTIPAPVLFDYLAVGVLAGGFWVRLGCVFNGCCGGRSTDAWFGVRLHDTRGVRKLRVPVQFMEMAWWLIGLAIFLQIWPNTLASGSYALAVVAWYGAARFFLDPVRERPDVVCGRVPINQLMAAVIAVAAGGTLIIRA